MKKGVVLLMGLLFIVTVYANDANVEYHPVTGRVFFSKSKVIDMVWEKVTYNNGFFITEFSFSNTTSKEQKIKMGFPIKSYADDALFDEYPEGGKEFDKAAYDMVQKELNFKSFINGDEFIRKLFLISEESMDEKDLKGYDYLFLGEVTFKPKETIKVYNTYNQNPIYIDSTDGCEYHTIFYRYKTGSSWKNPIKSSKITITFPYFLNPYDPYLQNYYTFDGIFGFAPKKYFLSINPEPTKLIKGDGEYTAIWDYKNISPDEDIIVNWGYDRFETDKKNETIVALINDMVESEDPEVIAEYHQDLYHDFQDKEMFYSFIVALGEGILRDYYDENPASLIRFTINGLNAVNGYKFKKPLWKTFFKQLKWYHPETDKPVLTLTDESLVDRLVEFGKNWKSKYDE